MLLSYKNKDAVLVQLSSGCVTMKAQPCEVKPWLPQPLVAQSPHLVPYTGKGLAIEKMQ